MTGLRPTERPRERQRLRPRDISGYRSGNTGTPYVFQFDSASPGPHAAIVALIHGNELCGAAALDTLLSQGVRPTRGKLSLIFANVLAYETFDPIRPFAARYLDEDMNRVWSAKTLSGVGDSRELARARELAPVLADADFLLDLHSTSSPAPAMILAGQQPKGVALARATGSPAHVVTDAGHAAGPRLRDFAAFNDPNASPSALLVECGEHFSPTSEDVALDVAIRFLLGTKILAAAPRGLTKGAKTPTQKYIDVTEAVTIRSEKFTFARKFRCFETIPKAATIIGHDGAVPVVTPYDNCILVMPATHFAPGQTAVRLGRHMPWPDA